MNNNFLKIKKNKADVSEESIKFFFFLNIQIFLHIFLNGTLNSWKTRPRT